MFLSGCFQALMGIFRLGGLVRYVPFPVMAGFQNATAVLIFFSQLPAMLGIARSVRPRSPSTIRSPADHVPPPGLPYAATEAGNLPMAPAS